MDQANVVSARRVDPLPIRPERPATLVEGRALSYTPALDGIRAFAVGGVLLYHAGVDWMSGGFLGVDAFFVLSGFLITSLLLGEWAKTGGIALRSFWARRARRLLPALFLVLGGVAVYARVYARPSELSSLRLDAFASLGYVANWRFVFSGQGYFDQFAAPSPLRHMWSLAIEEQFYLVWPVLLLGLLHLFRDRARQLALAVVTLAGLSLVVMLWLYEPGHDPSRVYYGTDTRAQSLLIGAFVAVAAGGIPVLGRRVRYWVHGAALVAVCVLGWMWCTANEGSTWLYQGGLTVAAVAIAIVIVSVTQRRSGPLGAVLSLSPLVWVGTISYGLYLWHWPIYLAMTPARTGLDGAGLVLARIGVSVVFATASYYLVERPVRFGILRRVGGRARTLGPALGVIVVVMVVAIVATTAGGRPTSAVVAAAAVSKTAAMPAPQVPPPSAAAAGATPTAVEPPPTKVMVVGDSVGLTLAAKLGASPEEHLAVWNRAALGCGIARSDAARVGGEVENVSTVCNGIPDRWPAMLDEFRPDVVMILAGAWEALDHKVDGHWLRVGSPEYHDWVLTQFRSATTILGSRGAQVVILTTPYFDPTVTHDPSREWPEFDPARVDVLNGIDRELARSSAGSVKLIDLNRYVSPAGKFTDTLDGVKIRDDGVHFTVEGSAYIAKWLAPRLRAFDPAHELQSRSVELQGMHGSLQ